MPDTAAPEEPAGVVQGRVVVERPVLAVRTLVVAALIVIAILGLAVLLSRVFDLLLILLVAIVFAEGMRPIVNRLAERRLPRPLAIAVVYLAFIAVLALLITLLVQPIVDEATTLAHNLPSYQASIQSTVTSWQHALNLGGSGSPNIGSTLAGGLDTAKNVLLTIGGYIVGVLVNLVLVLVIGFLWLVTSDRLKRFVVDLLPPRHQALAGDVFAEMGQRMGGFLRATAINMVVVGVLTGVACTALGLPSPVLLGIFAGLTAAIPAGRPVPRHRAAAAARADDRHRARGAGGGGAAHRPARRRQLRGAAGDEPRGVAARARRGGVAAHRRSARGPDRRAARRPGRVGAPGGAAARGRAVHPHHPGTPRRGLRARLHAARHATSAPAQPQGGRRQNPR